MITLSTTVYRLARAATTPGNPAAVTITTNGGGNRYAAWPYGCALISPPAWEALGRPHDGAWSILPNTALTPRRASEGFTVDAAARMLPLLDHTADRSRLRIAAGPVAERLPHAPMADRRPQRRPGMGTRRDPPRLRAAPARPHLHHPRPTTNRSRTPMPTPINAFTETGALLAILSDDPSEARRLITDMSPSERVTFAEQLTRLRDMLSDYCKVCDTLTPLSESFIIDAFSVDHRHVCRTCAEAARARREGEAP
ncbi:hypothetical protein SAMN05421505_12052 [Sinosporangium album]|uniref:Uncharacterized protein n=1 Tax=Sinosporangium album TaxID=504805 RepID=A0A1G8EDJ0_9ACTN|nr:hypothetical protein [Sinosporangium album]SDH67967.1 hypothetical protein SAMN05421505_12052 [Sinosporangium album]